MAQVLQPQVAGLLGMSDDDLEITVLDCPICMEPMNEEIIITATSEHEESSGQCNHSICGKCYQDLARLHDGKPLCPTCRRVITSVKRN